MLNCKHISQIKFTEAISTNSTRKLLWFEISKMLIAGFNSLFVVLLYYNFRNAFVPYSLLVQQHQIDMPV